MKRGKGGLPLTICFVLVLGGLSLWSLVKPEDVFSSQEKRYLAQNPEISLGKLLEGTYQEEYEAYLSDQFPGRLTLAKLRTSAERLLGKREIAGVYFGEDDYLMERHQEQVFSSQLAGENAKKLWKLANLAQEKGISQRGVMLVPSAEAVLRDKLPGLAPEAAEESWYQALRQEGDQETEGLHWYELQEELRGAAREETVYYRTDHHWNLYGAYLGYAAWARENGIAPTPWEAYERKTLKGDFYGSLSAKVQTEIRPDTLEGCALEKGISYKITYNEAEPGYASFYMEENLDTAEPYAVYLNGNQPLTRIRQENPAEEVRGKKLLLVKDSFGNSLAIFLAEHFEEIVMVDLRFRGIDLEKLMEQEQFTQLLAVYNRAQFCQLQLAGI
ncbi:MAG TPA: hypothetical protein IAB98_04855 [Candidatus Egerieimonas intestinavium]|uniref:AlgX/AlgJ SGNH hydrolase-like domain-containing protein n=1 Tax=Candidatus Egerieimonas intestinavium TaxID=2840777 RepID=A0A9D1EIS4_9FIRM|nr:hypothetical protein [Candidatus Egerieimonas intestinavium]